MDSSTMLILGALAAIVVAVGLWALNRAWGDFPGRAGQLPPEPKPPSAQQRQSRSRADLTLRNLDAPGLPPVMPPPSQYRSDASAQRVPIEHPLVRRAAEAALMRGDQLARYIVREGDRLYFDFEQISDPAQRQAAYDLMRRFNAGQQVNIREVMTLFRETMR